MEERGTEAYRFNARSVLGSGLTFFSGVRAENQFAGGSESQVYCLALEGSPLDHSRE